MKSCCSATFRPKRSESVSWREQVGYSVPGGRKKQWTTTKSCSWTAEVQPSPLKLQRRASAWSFDQRNEDLFGLLKAQESPWKRATRWIDPPKDTSHWNFHPFWTENFTTQHSTIFCFKLRFLLRIFRNDNFRQFTVWVCFGIVEIHFNYFYKRSYKSW